MPAMTIKLFPEILSMLMYTHTHTRTYTHTHTQANQEKQSCLEVQPSYSHPPKANSLIRESIFYFITLEFVDSYSQPSDPA